MSLVYHWKLDEADGESTIIDYSGNGVDGYYTEPSTGVTSYTSPIGTGLVITNDNYIVVPIASQVITDYPISLSGWARTTNSSLIRCIVSIGGTTEDEYLGIAKTSLGTTAGASRLLTRGGGEISSTNSSYTIIDGKWHHVVGVWVSSTERYLYTDGIKKDASGDPIIFPTDASEIKIGKIAGNLSGIPTGEWDGELDDIRVYDEALTEAQVKSLRNSGVRSWNDQLSPILLPKVNLSGGMQE